MFAIETQGLTRRFDKVTAVADLTLQVPKGALFGLIGPNGAGKTTTLRMLAGLLEPTSGKILYDGQEIDFGHPEWRRMIGYMPDFFGVYEDMLVWEYLDFFARCHAIPSIRRRQVIDELLGLVDLTEKKQAYVQTLSRGMRQRLCLAHILVHDPQVLLLDEPASGLDPRARVEMRELLRELGTMGKTIVVSSHILSELAELCDSIAIIEKGNLVISGSLDEINRYVHQGHTLHLKVVSDVVQAQQILRNQRGVGEIYEVNGILEVEYNGDEENMADLLSALVHSGVRLTSFTQATSNLEEIFLELTQGEVA